MRQPKGTPTALNLGVLRSYFMARDGSRLTEAPGKCESIHFAHLKRCLDAGLMEAASARTVRLTPQGYAILGWSP